ncbi:HAD family hydrolase [Actinopolyspora halophila]|uniref:HAD family hydrolase n=1 Tax=Actinopolyspora halophila TaxID=1850 RepID=UPI00037B3784|nr:HAD hydrolase-like protein [Actinopolyspora halophila]
MTSADVMRSLLRTVEVVLFDFDGPLCNVFAGLPAPAIANELTTLFNAHGQYEQEGIDDPHEVLRRVGGCSIEVLREVEDKLVTGEMSAVQVSEPNAAGIDSVRASLESGRSAAIVSNNAPEAVRWFLDTHGLADQISPVVGRPYADPAKMKPDPAPIREALAILGVSPDRAVLVGDSGTDLQVCQVTGVRCIAYANKPGKREQLREANVVIDDMAELAAGLREIS